MTRPWEDCEPCGTKDVFPMPGHRTLAEAWAVHFAIYKDLLASRRKPRKDEEGDVT